MIRVILTKTAFTFFMKELKANNIPIQSRTRTTIYFTKELPKLKMAIRMVRERFGSRSIIVRELYFQNLN